MTLRPSKLLPLCLFIFVHGYTIHFACLAKELDEDIAKSLEPFRDSTLTHEKRKQFREVVFRLPDWENRLANAMAKLAVASRYNGALDNRSWEMRPLFDRQESGTLTAEELQQLRDFTVWMSSEGKVINKIKEARTELQSILNALGEMGDERAIPFLCPVLAERSAVIDQFSDGPTGAPQNIAADALLVATFRGLTLPGIPNGRDLPAWRKWKNDNSGPPLTGQGAEIRAWRKWWRENRARYAPTPSALAELEATEGGTRPAAVPAPTPPTSPATPTPGAAAPAPIPEPPTPPTAKPEAGQSSRRISPAWLVLAPVVLLLVVFLIRRRAR